MIVALIFFFFSGEAQRNIAAMNDKHITSKNICIALESKVNELSQQLNDYITLNKQLSIQLAEEKSQQLALEESKSKYKSISINIICCWEIFSETPMTFVTKCLSLYFFLLGIL